MSDHGENKSTIANSVVGHVSFSMVAPKLNMDKIFKGSCCLICELYPPSTCTIKREYDFFLGQVYV